MTEEILFNKRIDNNGYVLIRSTALNDTEGWVMEHRFVVEQYIGRKLRPKEVVHHIDENKENNKIENLMVFQSQALHASFHRKIDKFRFNRTKPLQKEIDNRWNYLKLLDSNPKLQEAVA